MPQLRPRGRHGRGLGADGPESGAIATIPLVSSRSDRRNIDTNAEARVVLHGAHRLIESGWCRNADARDSGGLAVEPWDPHACSWSLLGALVAQTEPARIERGELELAALQQALAALANALLADSLSEWNDCPGRTAADVTAVLSHAMDELRAPAAVLERAALPRVS